MSSPPLDLRYPDLDYTLLKRIGEGAFAAVFSALGPHGPCAVKVVRKALLTPKQRADVLKEVSLLRRIDHPNIIRLLDFGESRESLPEDRAEGGEEGYYYLVLELMPGGELFTRVQELTFLSEEASRRVIVQVALAVHHLHRIGIVHRDIKLENLLFAPSPSYDPSLPTDDPRMQEDGGIGTVKLADFGLSKEIHHDLTATPCGTIGYTAPEIVLSNPYSKNVDIWALGCVLYTLLCGYPPFGGEAEEVTRRVAGGGWEFGRPWWDHVGWEAKDLITNSLILDPQRRFTIEQFLSHPWIRPELERLGMRPPAPQLAPAAAALAGRQGPAVPVWEKPPAPGWEKPPAQAQAQVQQGWDRPAQQQGWGVPAGGRGGWETPPAWKVPGVLSTPADERREFTFGAAPAGMDEDPRPQDTPSPQLDGAGAYDWNALASLAHDRGLRAQQEMLSSDGYAGEQHPAWQPPPATHRIPLLSPAVPALPPRTPLTREAIDASYFAVRGLEEEAEASHTSVRSLGPSGRNGNGGLLPATASIAFGGAAMPSGSITPGGSVRNANFGIVRAAPGGLLGSGFYARSRAARTPGGREVNVGPSPLAFAASGPPSVPLSEGSTPSSEGSGAGFDASAGSTGATAGLAPPPAQSGGGGGFELKIGDSSLLARRKGGKALLKAATDTPPMPSPAALAVGKGMQPRTSTAPGLAMPSVGADVVDRAQEAEEDGARLGMQQLRISGRR